MSVLLSGLFKRCLSIGFEEGKQGLMDDEDTYMRSYGAELLSNIQATTGIDFSVINNLDLTDPEVVSDRELAMMGAKPLSFYDIIDLGEGVGSFEVAMNFEASKAEMSIFTTLLVLKRQNMISEESFEVAQSIIWGMSHSEIMAEKFGDLPEPIRLSRNVEFA